jgi:undecaprenyl-diphosphatase
MLHNYFSDIFLGIVQGLTEFLPISSSGHLILMRDILNMQVVSGLAYDAVLQLATTLAILVYFRKDIYDLAVSFFKLMSRTEIEDNKKSLLLAVIIGTIPAVFFGLLLEGYMETIFRSSVIVAATLFVGGLVMLISEYVAQRFDRASTKISIKKGLIIGLFQSLALIPGMSRSGMTISGGLFVGINREVATRFSFILAFPVLLGSGIKKFIDLQNASLVDLNLLVGFIASFVFGLLAIHFLIKFLKKNSLKAFVFYRWVLALIVLVVL